MSPKKCWLFSVQEDSNWNRKWLIILSCVKLQTSSICYKLITDVSTSRVALASQTQKSAGSVDRADRTETVFS